MRTQTARPTFWQHLRANFALDGRQVLGKQLFLVALIPLCWWLAAGPLAEYAQRWTILQMALVLLPVMQLSHDSGATCGPRQPYCGADRRTAAAAHMTLRLGLYAGLLVVGLIGYLSSVLLGVATAWIWLAGGFGLPLVLLRDGRHPRWSPTEKATLTWVLMKTALFITVGGCALWIAFEFPHMLVLAVLPVGSLLLLNAALARWHWLALAAEAVTRDWSEATP